MGSSRNLSCSWCFVTRDKLEFERGYTIMSQIIKNYMLIFVVPFLIGVAVRFLCRRAKRSYLITAGFAVLVVIGWAAFYIVPSHGSEMYGIIALMATSAAVGALLAGVIVRSKRKVS